MGGSSSQTHLEFIPERTTDFIFAVFSEEFGLVGNVLLLVLYLALIMRGFVIAANAPTFFSRLLAGAVTLTFFTYAFVNMGMVSGLLPVVEPEGLAPYIDAARNMGLPPDICATDSGLIGCVLEEIQPPVDMVVTPTTPCDSALSAYQILTRLIERRSSTARCLTGTTDGAWNFTANTSGR
jgi:hypothetical protein